MPFLDHLEELRWRLLYSLLAIVLGTVVGWVVVERLDVIGLLMRPIAPHLPGGRLNYTSPTDPFFITLKFAFIVGLVVSSPFVLWQLWAFLAPALYEREKRLVVPAIMTGMLLFLGGAAGGYFLVLPRALAVLLSFQNQALQPIITADRYFGFAAQIILAFGAVTELPLVVVVLTALGLVSPAGLRKNRRFALLVAAALAAFLTPPDALSMLMMMVPLLLLYELSIWCSWVVTRRRAKAAARAVTALAIAFLVVPVIAPRSAAAQVNPRVNPRADSIAQARARDSVLAAGRPLDSAAARRLGLPTGPTRQFPAGDPMLDSLLKLKGYRIIHYVADTMVVLGDSDTIVLNGEALVDRDGTKLEADSIHYRESSCRLDAVGDPKLFDEGTVLVGEGMRYDTCLRRGTVCGAMTDFQQGGATWIMRGKCLAVDSGSTRMYGSKSDITSDERPVPAYHFAAGEVKWLNKTLMVARPVVLYVNDVPIIWLPFIFNDIRPGRRSGVLVPRFGLNDLVRPTRGYQRHVSNIGYYLVLNDYIDVMASADWFSSRYLAARGELNYRWLDRFVQGGLRYSRTIQLDETAHSDQIIWNHNQSFNSRTRFAASVNYATSARVVQRNTIDPFLTTAQLSSNANFDKRFGWGTLNMGGSMSQNLSNNLRQQNFPRVSITPAPIDIAPWITWSPGFNFNNTQTFHNVGVPITLLTSGGVVGVDSTSFDTRASDLSLSTPLRIGRWNWSNAVAISDKTSNQRVEFVIPDPIDSTVKHHVVYDRTFETRVDWNTGINLPQLFSGTWRLQPGVQIVNKTSAGPFMLRNQFTGGQFLQQGKRLQFSLGLAPTFFGFFPGVGPFARIRHSVSMLVSYAYAPGSKVPKEFATALDPTGRLLNARSDPQQTVTMGLQQSFEAKYKTPAGDSSEAEPRKIRLLSIATSGVSYNFEQAKIPGRVGWQTQTLTNTLASDLLPGFNLQFTHDLWLGQVGLASTKFQPFLQSLSANFSLTSRTLAAIGGLIGLGGGPPARTPPPTPTPEGGQPPRLPQGPRGFGGMGTSPYAGGGGRGFTLNVQFSTQRTRPDTVAAPPPGSQSRSLSGGRQQMSLNMAFSPTPNWTASWNTLYDFDTRRFPQHFVRLERDLHRWHASFYFSRTASGNFAFSFYVALLDQPDIKFDYDQQSYPRTQ
jgi:Tat protein translocase TatC